MADSHEFLTCDDLAEKFLSPEVYQAFQVVEVKVQISICLSPSLELLTVIAVYLVWLIKQLLS